MFCYIIQYSCSTVLIDSVVDCTIFFFGKSHYCWPSLICDLLRVYIFQCVFLFDNRAPTWWFGAAVGTVHNGDRWWRQELFILLTQGWLVIGSRISEDSLVDQTFCSARRNPPNKSNPGALYSVLSNYCVIVSLCVYTCTHALVIVCTPSPHTLTPTSCVQLNENKTERR